MPELFLELFSEEIPARMQRAAAGELQRLLCEALSALAPNSVETYYGPRRIALMAHMLSEVPAARRTERGPRVNAPQHAVDGFLRKHGATNLDQVREEGGYWVLDKATETRPASTLIATALPQLLRRFPWPKSMRWGGGSNFVWVRPLRRIVCLLDGEVVPFDLHDGDDDGHGLTSGDLTEGHRFHAPGAFAVESCDDWATKLRDRYVQVDANERKRIMTERIAELAAGLQIQLVDDPGLLDEVAGLVEWPVPLLGRIDEAFMDLPPEVRQVSMRVNQRYFTFRSADGSAAPYFGFVSNIDPADGGATSIAGNERVLRARFADARHFWDLDRKARLESRVPLLDHITFHAKLGSQGERVRRLERLAEEIAPLIGAGPALARDAARLAKADLVTGMVGEFPELQGVMGRYYALHDGEDPLVADAIRDHYAPRGPADAVPTADVSIAVALADKLDLLVGFFAIGERPTGAGDPYALRRAALGIIRIVRENGLRLPLLPLVEQAVDAVEASARARHLRRQEEAGEQARKLGVVPGFSLSAFGEVRRNIPGTSRTANVIGLDVVQFVIERLRVQLRSEGASHDVLDAVWFAHWDDDLVRILARTQAVAALLRSDNGANLLTAYRRAANILRIEARKDGPFDAGPNDAHMRTEEERRLFHAAAEADAYITGLLRDDDYETALAALAELRSPLDVFFDKVTVNAPEPDLRLNRLRLLHKVRSTMDRIADFSKIEG